MKFKKKTIQGTTILWQELLFAIELVCFLKSYFAPVKWLVGADHVSATMTEKKFTRKKYVVQPKSYRNLNAAV
jgi:hypothetical protein